MNKERFEFGKNWRSFSRLIDAGAIEKAERRLVTFLGTQSLAGRTFLDIGCGSGLHTLAALRLGVQRAHAVDLDPDAIATTRAVLDKYWPKENVMVEPLSVFDLEQHRLGEFDIVYSWGVLHHTGDMHRALVAAARRVRTGGVLAVALYGKTRYCGLWKRMKRWYVNATPEQRSSAEKWYVRLFGFYMLLRGKRLSTHIANYQNKRGMDFYHDVRDWIGGYPYESITPKELMRVLSPLGFEMLKQNVRKRSGLFGSGNDEFLLHKTARD